MHVGVDCALRIRNNENMDKIEKKQESKRTNQANVFHLCQVNVSYVSMYIVWHPLILCNWEYCDHDGSACVPMYMYICVNKIEARLCMAPDVTRM